MSVFTLQRPRRAATLFSLEFTPGESLGRIDTRHAKRAPHAAVIDLFGTQLHNSPL